MVGNKYADKPCRRCNPTSEVDHFEPLEPAANEDGIDVTPWLESMLENNRLLLERERQQSEGA